MRPPSSTAIRSARRTLAKRCGRRTTSHIASSPSPTHQCQVASTAQARIPVSRSPASKTTIIGGLSGWPPSSWPWAEARRSWTSGSSSGSIPTGAHAAPTSIVCSRTPTRAVTAAASVLERAAHQRQGIDAAGEREIDDERVAGGRVQAAEHRPGDGAGHPPHGDEHEHRQRALGHDEGDREQAEAGRRAPHQRERADPR
jgi:hypothetical protein